MNYVQPTAETNLDSADDHFSEQTQTYPPMKRTLKLLSAMTMAGALLLGSATAETSKVAEALDGKLVKIEGDSATEATLSGDPEYYVFYHSASW